VGHVVLPEIDWIKKNYCKNAQGKTVHDSKGNKHKLLLNELMLFNCKNMRN